MGKTDKQWRLPANRNYRGKVTMMEVKTLLKEYDKNNQKPETIVVNSGELAAKAIGVDLMNIKAENTVRSSAKKAQVEDNVK